jgi:oxygen-independent coproporphyrinogen-3 oxidase
MSSLYIHIPFCEKKCLYCSFAVAVGQAQRVEVYLDALMREARRYPARSFKTVYIGGGTPTFLNPSQIEKLVGGIRAAFDLSGCEEFTVEANPEGLTVEKTGVLKDVGVTRVSLGVQSLKDGYLRSLGRVHDRKTALDAFALLRAADFRNINLDLMFSFPEQTDREIEEDVRAICALGSEHVSLYSLTIEPYSRFFAKKIKLADNEDRARQYALIVKLLQEYGFEQYEVSNFAKPRYESRHNINYWRSENYLGLGMSAHSHLDGRRFWNVPRLAEYLERISGENDPKEDEETLPPEKRFVEAMLIGLRMNAGVCIAALEERFDCRLDPAREEKIGQFIEAGLLVREGGILRAPLEGFLVLDEICAGLV